MQLDKTNLCYKTFRLNPRYFTLQIPEEWQIKKLEEVTVRIENGFTYSENNDNEGVPITRIETIWDGTIDRTRVGHVRGLDNNTISRYKLGFGDILLSHINSLGHIGKSALYQNDPPLLLHGMNLMRISPRTSVLDPFFLYFLFKYERTRSRLRAISNAAINQVSINATQLKKFEIPVPPLPIQAKIGLILSKVDELIQKMNQIIEQTQRLKKGLMYRLLIKGFPGERLRSVDISGQTQNIPSNWSILELSKLVNDMRYGTSVKCTDKPEGIPVIRIPNIINGTGSSSRLFTLVSRKAVICSLVFIS
jgi:type I restriction enzyme S subunit